MQLSSWQCFCVFVVLALATMQGIQAVPMDVDFDTGALSEGNGTYRYRYAEQPWQNIKDGQTVLELRDFEGDDFLIIQEFSQGLIWGTEQYYRFDGVNNDWHRVQDPLNDVQLDITIFDSSIISLRYQIGTSLGQDWKPVESGKDSILLSWFDPETFLFVQQSKDGDSWSEVFQFKYDQEQREWVLLSPSVITDFQRIISAYVVMMRTTEAISGLYESSCGGGIEMLYGISFDPKMLIVLDLTASHAASSNSWIDQFLILDANAGLAYRISLMKRLNLVPSITYGILAHTGNADLDGDGNAERLWYVDQQVRGALRLELILTDRVRLVLKPEAAVFFEMNTIGVLYGIGAGLQFGW
jgi:hypothetical protein